MAEVSLDAIFARSFPVPNSGCWLWMGYIMKDGYGQIGSKPWTAHKLSFELAYGPVPEGLEVDHICRVRSCINPDHLQALTHAENIKRGDYSKNRNQRKTHCPKMHPLSGRNLVIEKTSVGKGFARKCAECRLANQRLRYQKAKGKHNG